MTTTERIDTILKKYINEHIPKKATNIFWQMFNGIEAIFESLQYRLDISKRERNILTAQNISSLRNLAAQNGFQPTLKLPSSGTIKVAISSKLFNRCGFPLYIAPYTIFVNRATKLQYYYVKNSSLKIDSSEVLLHIIEGELKNSSFISQGNTIEKIYLQESNVGDSSIAVEVNSISFLEVPSFFQNENLNQNHQFVVKFSNDAQNPIVIYIKGTTLSDTILVTYRLTNGELGNIPDTNYFETEGLLDGNGTTIDASDDEITITNIAGFDLGSNGTDINSLKAAIGYNHSSLILSDKVSYGNFLSRFSTILIQQISSTTQKSIKNLYLQRKQSINFSTENTADISDQYKNIVTNQSYQLSASEINSLQELLDENEYALASSYISNPLTCSFAFQLKFSSQVNIDLYRNELIGILYSEFGKFLYLRTHSINIELLFHDFMQEKNVDFEYTIFNQADETAKIENSAQIITSYIINHDTHLPLLNGNFDVCGDDIGNKFRLFFDINFVTV